MTPPAHPPNRSSPRLRHDSQHDRRHDRREDLHQDHRSQREPEVVSGSWLVKALLGTLIAAGAALYLTVCLLFYQGQWQFVFLPPKLNAPVDVSQLAVSSGLPITEVKFDYTEQGVAHLDGWWIPANIGPASQAPSQRIVLYCPNGRTTLPANIAALQSFHHLGTAVFAYDYRGFGQSQSGHPSQQKSYEDGLAALHYLTATRHIDLKRIVIYGTGVGAAVAVYAAQQSPEIAALILENPQPSFAKQVKREQHIHVLPLWLIFPERFDIAPAMAALKMPKLFLLTSKDADAVNLYRQASAPKQMVSVPSNSAIPLYSQPAWQQVVQEFLR